MNEVRKLYHIFRFIDDLYSINDCGEFETNYCNIDPEELGFGKENNDKDEASVLDLDIKIRAENFTVGFFNKRDSFPLLLLKCLSGQVMNNLT